MSKPGRVGSCLVASLFVFALASGTNEASARGFGGGHGHGGGGGGGGGGFRAGGAHFGGGSFRGMSGAGLRSGMGGLNRNFAVRSSSVGRSFTSFHSTRQFSHTSRSLASQNFTRMGSSRALTRSGNLRLGSNSLANRSINRQFAGNNRNLVTGSVNGAGRTSLLRNPALASFASRNGTAGMLRQASFNGALAGRNWKNWNGGNWNGNGGWWWLHNRPIFVIGWFGPVFWPFAYWDFIDYTFWPYAYDAFWPYAFDDVYVGVFGPYAYEGRGYANVVSSRRHARRTRDNSTITSVVCGEQAPALTNWPIEQISQTVQPTESQQTDLNELKDATGKAVSALQSACPEDLPSTAPGRLAAMDKRIATMLLALSIVQPPLQRFYDSLSDEQKARFNVVSSDPQTSRTARASDRSPDLSQVCGADALKPVNMPTDRIAKTLSPTDSQRSALDSLNEATRKAAEFLKANCPTEQAFTPPGRISAMEHRLQAMQAAIKTVQPALENFYNLLTDEQKARFNLLGSQQI